MAPKCWIAMFSVATEYSITYLLLQLQEAWMSMLLTSPVQSKHHPALTASKNLFLPRIGIFTNCSDKSYNKGLYLTYECLASSSSTWVEHSHHHPQVEGSSHRHISNIDCLMTGTAWLVCLISTVVLHQYCSKEEALEDRCSSG